MYQNIIYDRHITRLCHFTKTKNLPFILGNGEDSNNGVVANQYITDLSFLEKIDQNRFDNHENYICTSVQYPNCLYFSTAITKNKENIFNEWVILEIDPHIINDYSKFCPVNAATKNGSLISSGVNSFEGLFDSVVTGKKEFKRNIFYPDNLPTNIQAEVLIYQMIDKADINGLIFPNKNIAQKECLRLELCNIDLNELTIKESEELFDKKRMLDLLNKGETPEERILNKEDYGL